MFFSLKEGQGWPRNKDSFSDSVFADVVCPLVPLLVFTPGGDATEDQWNYLLSSLSVSISLSLSDQNSGIHSFHSLETEETQAADKSVTGHWVLVVHCVGKH